MPAESTNREVRLAARPQGWPTLETFELAEVPVPEPADGQVLVRNIYMSVDPYMRGRMNAAKSYAPPYQVGKAMYGGAVGQVVASRAAGVAEGGFVRTGLGWREYAVVAAEHVESIDTEAGPLSAHLGVLGMPGMTAYVGLFEIGKAQPGETVFVSAASGAVGSIVGQLAKLHGCRVIGSAGGPEKVAFLRDELGFDAAIDYREGRLAEALLEAAPDGVDVYFDNVGGEHLQAALTAMNPFGRLAECGMISQYNEPTPGPDNLFLVVGKKLTMRGFIVSDHADKTADFVRLVGGYLRAGQLVAPETVVEGIEAAPQALLDVLRGGTHLGKLVVRLAPDPTAG